jgi:phospholipase/carboxylesterase
MKKMHKKDINSGGKSLAEAKKVLIMLHGRGASAEDILALSSYLNVNEFALLAPQATHNTWYPNSFMAPPAENEPWLSSALETVKDLLEMVKSNGFESHNIYFLGFSQGACLTLEFVTRNAEKFGGVAAFTGGLIGDQIYQENYSGNFEGTPIFIGSGNPDAHVPVERVKRSAEILDNMNASVRVEIYDNRPHTISKEELEQANKLIFK